jgi:outer membrane protein assembly factor BamB
MKKLLALAALVVGAASPVFPQPGTFKVHTNPVPPTREALYRLNLNMAWRTKLPVDGKRDGLFSIQLIPGTDRPQMVVQTFAGAVILLDAETGDPLWRTSLAEPYWIAQPVAFDDYSILTTRREFLYILDRANGSHRLVKPELATGKPVYGMQLPAVPSAAPAAGQDMVVFCFENRVSAYRLPSYGAPVIVEEEDKKETKEGPPKNGAKTAVNGKAQVTKPAPEDDEENGEGEKKRLTWPALKANYEFERLHFAAPPLKTASQAAVVSTDGTFMSLDLKERFIRNSYKLSGGVAAAATQHGTYAYIPSEDYTLYAMDMLNGRLLWRFLSGGPILRTPAVTDRDVFVTPDRSGLFRVDRASGDEVWRNRKAERFLAANPRFVYALDRLGNLLVLDYARGTELAQYDARDWIIAVPNELTDRIYLAAHDGQIMCLHHRDHAQPVSNREKKVPPAPPEEKKDNKDEKKDEKKDDKTASSANASFPRFAWEGTAAMLRVAEPPPRLENIAARLLGRQ